MYAIAVAGLGDLIGALAMPFGPYFWGWTLSCILTGLIYGVILYRNPNKETKEWKFITKILIANILAYGFIHIMLNAVWLSFQFGEAYKVILFSRLSIQLVMMPIQMILIYALYKALKPLMQKDLYEKEEVKENEPR